MGIANYDENKTVAVIWSDGSKVAYEQHVYHRMVAEDELVAHRRLIAKADAEKRAPMRPLVANAAMMGGYIWPRR